MSQKVNIPGKPQKQGQLFQDIPLDLPEELIETILVSDRLRSQLPDAPLRESAGLGEPDPNEEMTRANEPLFRTDFRLFS